MFEVIIGLAVCLLGACLIEDVLNLREQRAIRKEAAVVRNPRVVRPSISQ